MSKNTTDNTAWEQVTKETLYKHFIADKERHKTIAARYGVTESTVDRKLRGYGICLSPEERRVRRSEDRRRQDKDRAAKRKAEGIPGNSKKPPKIADKKLSIQREPGPQPKLVGSDPVALSRQAESAGFKIGYCDPAYGTEPWATKVGVRRHL